jgi:transcriptional regulator of arginine metabolism
MSNFKQEILNIIQKNTISDHFELQAKLSENGISISQATLSRKLKQLKIVKVLGTYTVAFEKKEPDLLLNIHSSETGMIVLHTQIGQANRVGYIIDQWEDKEGIGILGTIAGDDTVLIIARSLSEVENIKLKIKMVFQFYN